MSLNLGLRWMTVSGTGWWLLDCLLLAYVVRTLHLLLGQKAPRLAALHWLENGILAAALVILSSVMLSVCGALHWPGFIGLHSLAAASCWLVRRRWPSPTATPRTGSPTRSRRWFGSPLCLERGMRGLARVAIGILVAYALILAVSVFAVNWDSSSYRLPRVGLWLQDQRVSLNFANDDRLFYMPINAEIWMVWATSFFPTGFPLVNLPQFFGGCLSVLATLELGRLAGLSRLGRLFAGLLLLGMPNVYLEMATSQSDLVTCGLLNAGLVFLWIAIRSQSRRYALFAGLALGLALGSKGTVIYWIPGLSGWLVLLLWRDCPASRCRLAGGLSILAATVALAVGGWKYADNLARYGNPFASKEHLALLHRHGADRGAENWFIAKMHFWQLLQANSHPSFLAPILRPLDRWMIDYLDATAPTPQLRQEAQNLRVTYYKDQVVAEDTVSFGFLVFILSLAGWISAGIRLLWKPARTDWARFALGLALGLFLVVFFVQQSLSPWNYRLFIILGPFIAVLGASLFPKRPGYFSYGVIALLMIVQAYGALELQARNVLGGWRSLCYSEARGSTSLFESLQRQFTELPAPLHRIGIALPLNDWPAPYFRTTRTAMLRFISLEETRAQASPLALLKKYDLDALIVRPGVFPQRDWPEVTSRTNAPEKLFPRVFFYRSAPGD